jgi:hypothetical protein
LIVGDPSPNPSTSPPLILEEMRDVCPSKLEFTTAIERAKTVEKVVLFTTKQKVINT